MVRFPARSWFTTVALVAACAGADSKAASDTTSAAAAPAPVEVAKETSGLETASYAPALGVDLAASTRLPTGMYTRDITVGTGPIAQAGMQVTTHYWGYFTDGNLFETSEKSSPIAFQLGRKQVIDGWDQGIVGMKVGGKRQLIIPSALGYGPSGSGKIPPNSNLIFTVELVGAK